LAVSAGEHALNSRAIGVTPDRWEELEYDLSPFRGEAVTLRLTHKYSEAPAYWAVAAVTQE
jgi:hypothetical protein